MKYGFIGCGNMGSAVARALRQATSEIMVSDRSGKARVFAEELGISYGDNATIADTCDCIFLAVKPHLVKGVLAPLQSILVQRKPMLISMAAGLELAQIEAFAATSLPLIRIMPNTPTSIGQGVIQYCHNDLVSKEALQDWLQDMRYCGLVDSLDESLIDAASALSGSGPAYMYVFLEALADGAVACGLPRSKAMEYAAMTMAGAAQMYLQTKTHPGALKDAVCSPGGSTIAGIRALEQHGFRGAAMDCVIATCNRNKELGK
ncbi:MAG: pyrroline-5-carboxylate reductase [Oscillospiraceae bacterium]|nr:pyrroline-5-carboxylate reductase [Oscillospiraceae bacterium]